MDEFYFDDPRNAARLPFGIVPRAPAGAPVRPPASRPPGYAFAAPTYAQPYPPTYAQPYPPTYAQPVLMPAQPSKLRTRLGDLTVGDLVPVIAQLIVGFRPMPVAPTDTRDPAANVVNLAKFVEAIAGHFHGDAQINAAGTALGKLLG